MGDFLSDVTESAGATRRAFIGATVGTLLLPGLSSPARASTVDIGQVYEAAKREKRLTYYFSSAPAITDRLLAGFKAAYPGIEVDLFRLSPGPLGRRFEAETSAGTYVADVLQIADPLLVGNAGAKGWLKELTDLPAHDSFPMAFKTADSAVVRIDPHTVTYNSRLVKAGEAPKAWTDLLDPRWKGKFLCPDLRISIMLINWATLMADTYGASFLTKLATQDVRWTPSQIPGSQLLAAGEAQLLFPNQKQVTQPLIDTGAPLVDVVPGPFTGHESVLAIPAKAPHPNAAALMANFIMSRKGAELLAKDISYSPLPDVPGALPMPAKYQRVKPLEAIKRQAEIQELLKIK